MSLATSRGPAPVGVRRRRPLVSSVLITGWLDCSGSTARAGSPSPWLRVSFLSYSIAN